MTFQKLFNSGRNETMSNSIKNLQRLPTQSTLNQGARHVLFQRLLPLLAVLAVFSFTVLPVNAATIFIDDFGSPALGHESTASLVAPANGSPDVVDGLPPAMVIGGSRDLFARKTAGGTNNVISSRTNTSGLGRYAYSSDESTNGWASVVWDGTAAGGDLGGNPMNVLGDALVPTPPATQVKFDGLGGIDLTAGGLATSLDMFVLFSDLGGPVTFTVWDNDDPSGATFAELTMVVPFLIPGVNPMQTIPYSFASFTPTNAALASTILDSAGAIQMTIDGRAGPGQSGWDLAIDYVRIESLVPEPSSVALAGIGLLGLTLLGRRRRRN